MRKATILAASVALFVVPTVSAQVTGIRAVPAEPQEDATPEPVRQGRVQGVQRVSPTGEGANDAEPVPTTRSPVTGFQTTTPGRAGRPVPTVPGAEAVSQPSSSKPAFQAPWGCAETWPVSTYSNHGPDANSIDTVKRDEDLNSIGQFLPVVASAPGVVTFDRTWASDDKQGERWIYVDHDNGWRTHYIHMAEDDGALPIGRRVGMGEVLGKLSDTGQNVTVHLHYGQIDDVNMDAAALAAVSDADWTTAYWDGDGNRQEYNGVLLDTHAGDMDMWGRWGDANAEMVQSSNCANSEFVHWFTQGNSYIMRYRPSDNSMRVNRIDPAGTNHQQTYSEADRGTNWTHFTRFYSDASQAHLIKYSYATGDVEFVRMSPSNDGMTTVSEFQIYDGWTHWETVRFNSGWHTIAYDSLHGFFNVDKINVQNNGFLGGLQTSIGTGYTSIVPYEDGPRRYVIAYKSGTGEARVFQLSSQDNGEVTINTVSNFQAGRDWTHMVLLQNKGARHLLGYNSMTGRAMLWDISGQGAGVSNATSFNWSPGVNSLTPFYDDGNAFVILYRLSDGHVQKIRMNDAGTAFSVATTENWSDGFR